MKSFDRRQTINFYAKANNLNVTFSRTVERDNRGKFFSGIWKEECGCYEECKQTEERFTGNIIITQWCIEPISSFTKDSGFDILVRKYCPIDNCDTG